MPAMSPPAYEHQLHAKARILSCGFSARIAHTWAKSCSSVKWRMTIAPNWQVAAHEPQPAHIASVTTAISPFFHVIAANGHTEAHRPHFLHSSVSMRLVMASMRMRSALSRPPAREDAAPAWQGRVFDVLRRSRSRRRKDAARGRIHGLSFGCDSMKSRRRSSRASAAAKSWRGPSAAPRRPRARPCQFVPLSLPAVVFSTVTIRLRVAGSSSRSPGRPRT